MSLSSKCLADFELFGPNLIEGVPFEFGYVLKESNRAIQKVSYEDLMKAVSQNPSLVQYIKEGPDVDFMPFGVKVEHFGLKEEKRLATEKVNRKRNKITFIIGLLVSIVIIWNYLADNLFEDRPLVHSQIILLTLGWFIIGFIRKPKKKEFNAEREERILVQEEWHRKNRYTFNSILFTSVLLVCFFIQYLIGMEAVERTIAINASGKVDLVIAHLFGANFVQKGWFYGIMMIISAYFAFQVLGAILKGIVIWSLFILLGSLGFALYYSLGSTEFVGSFFALAGLSGVIFYGSRKFEIRRNQYFNNFSFVISALLPTIILAKEELLITGIGIILFIIGYLIAKLMPKSWFQAKFIRIINKKA